MNYINAVHEILAAYGCAVPTQTLRKELKHRIGGYVSSNEMHRQIDELRARYRIWYCRYSEGKGWHLDDPLADR